MKGIIGRYNVLRYEVVEAEADARGEMPLHEGGNNPYDSTSVIEWNEGIGLEQMKELCEHTAKEFAEELGLPFLGIEPLEE